MLSITSTLLQAKQLMRSTTSIFFVSWEMQYDEKCHSYGSYGQLVIGSLIMTLCLLVHHVSCRAFWQSLKSPRWLSPTTVQIWHFTTSGFSQNQKYLFKGRNFRPSMRFRKIWQGIWWLFKKRISQSVLNSRRDIGRTVWGPKVDILNKTEASLSYVQYFLYLLQ